MLPTEQGVYLAKTDVDYEWWNVIAYVYGESPYLRLDVWNYEGHELFKDWPVNRIAEWGAKLDEYFE